LPKIKSFKILGEPGNHQARFVGTLSSLQSIQANLPKAGMENRENFPGGFGLYRSGQSTMLNINALRSSRNTILLFSILISPVFHPIQVLALGDSSTLPDFGEFSKSVQNNKAGVLRGVYVPDVLAFPIVQQPVGNIGYVSLEDGQITQFGMPSQFGNVGLLAHNNLSGRFFSKLAVGQEVRLVYGDGRVEYFVITQILKFQALDPTSPYSTFRDLSNAEKLTAEQLFKKVYRGDRHVTFQTCIEANGESSWGRLFVMAMPKPEYQDFDHYHWHN
jgi:hypothetical protein